MPALRALALGLALLLGVAAAQDLVAVPELRARVTDLTGTLDAGARESLERRLAAFEAEKGSQIAVLIVPTTQPEAIEQYGIRVAEAWKLGRKGVDDGAILIVAKNDRRLRIEVGYGLEGVLNDAVSKRIISETITPRFRRGDYAGGIDAGVSQMIDLVHGEALPPPAARRGADGRENLLGMLLVPFFFLWFVGQLLRRLFGSSVAAVAVGGIMGFIAFALLASLGLALLVGVVATIVALVFYLGGGPGGFYPGGYGRGGGLGGGVFGGGGGGFGGGGASGDW